MGVIRKTIELLVRRPIVDPGKVVERAVDPLLRGRGFRRSGRTWRRDHAEVIHVFHVQRSQFGPQFYLNCGIYLRAIGDTGAPPVHRCHVAIRVDGLAGGHPGIRDALDFESNFNQEQRETVLRRTIEDVVVPWFDTRDTEASLRAALLARQGDQGLVMAVAREYLGIERAV